MINRSAAVDYLRIVQDERRSKTLLLTSDIHTSGLADIDTAGVDIIVLAGDVMGGGYRSDKAGQRFLDDYLMAFFRKNSDKKIVLTAGNHDKYLYRLWERDRIPEFPRHVHFLLDSGCTIDGIRFWGTPWCPKDREGRFETTGRDLAEKFSKIPSGLDFLVSHCPPLVVGEKVDVFKGGHDGSAELTEVILKKKPKFVICGHVHSGSRVPVEVGESKVINVARVDDDRSEESCKPRVLRYTYDK